MPLSGYAQARSTAFFGALLAMVLWAAPSLAASAEAWFQQGVAAYQAGEYPTAVKAFREAVARRPAAGTLQNLGNAEWQQGRAGEAVLAWEQALWLDPFHRPAEDNLRYARKNAQLETPDLTWYEVVSTWLPVSWWAWIGGFSFWLAVGMALLPGIFRWRKAAWQQAVAALSLMVFLLCIPAQAGVWTRSGLGFVLEKNVPLRLTPTQDAQAITRLAAGEPVRRERVRGRYVLVRTNRSLGWIEQSQLGLICPKR